jgi:hypothetical protein
MPDLAMCSSTVCSVRKNCMRNWDSGAYVPDLDPAIQKWIPDRAMIGVGYSATDRPEDCSWFKPLHHFPKANVEDTWA